MFCYRKNDETRMKGTKWGLNGERRLEAFIRFWRKFESIHAAGMG